MNTSGSTMMMPSNQVQLIVSQTSFLAIGIVWWIMTYVLASAIGAQRRLRNEARMTGPLFALFSVNVIHSVAMTLMGLTYLGGYMSLHVWVNLRFIPVTFIVCRLFLSAISTLQIDKLNHYVTAYYVALFLIVSSTYNPTYVSIAYVAQSFTPLHLLPAHRFSVLGIATYWVKVLLAWSLVFNIYVHQIIRVRGPTLSADPIADELIPELCYTFITVMYTYRFLALCKEAYVSSVRQALRDA